MRAILNQFAMKRGFDDLCFWGNDFPLSPALEKLLHRFPKFSGTDVEMLKMSERRSVFRVLNFSVLPNSLIVKGFPLRKIESQLTYKKYGLSEFANYQQAATRCIPTPRCYGYFEVRRFGLVRANGVLVEDLSQYESLASLAKKEPARRYEIFLRAIPILKLLLEQGVNHIDVSPQNLMEHRETAELRLIDWQYCAFVKPGQPAQLTLHAAHFLRYGNLPATSPEGHCWLERLLAETGCAVDKSEFLRNVAALQTGRKVSSENRIQLKFDARSLAA